MFRIISSCSGDAGSSRHGLRKGAWHVKNDSGSQDAQRYNHGVWASRRASERKLCGHAENRYAKTILGVPFSDLPM